MPNTPHDDERRFVGLSERDFVFALGVVTTIVIAVALLISDPYKPAFDINTIQKIFIPTLSMAVLSALVFASLYAFVLFRETSFLFISLCWLANLVYTICSMVETTERQMYVTFIVALLADVPLFLSAFSEKQRKWWLPLVPVTTILFSLIFYSPERWNTQTTPSSKLLILYIFGPLSSAAILFWTSYSLYRRHVIKKQIKYIGYYSLTFLILGLLQIPFTYKSLCYFAPALFDCQLGVKVLSIAKTGILATKLGNIGILFIMITHGLTSLYQKQASVEHQLKIKGEFEELGFFAASIEHELRNPLEVLRGGIEDLSDQVHSVNGVQAHFAKIEHQLDRMSTAANIINVLRLKKEEMASRTRPMEVMGIVNQAIKYIKIELEPQIKEIHFPINEKTNHLMVNVDSSLLEQCLVNIFKNAIESLTRSKRGGAINTDIFLLAKDRVGIAIRDPGEGFLLEDIPRLIDPTYTTKAKSSKKANRGLGLFVSERIVSLHDGKIAFSNHKDGGALVTLELPRYLSKRMQKEAMV